MSNPPRADYPPLDARLFTANLPRFDGDHCHFKASREIQRSI
jgi:hypothetical protein